jgi:hypothetical protein
MTSDRGLTLERGVGRTHMDLNRARAVGADDAPSVGEICNNV